MDASTTSTTLPPFVPALVAQADETRTIVAGGGSVTLIRLGAVIVNFVEAEGTWHVLASAEEAQAKFTELVALADEVEQYIAGGGDWRAMAMHRETGMPLEMAEAMVQQVTGSTCDHPECQPGYQAEQAAPAERAIGRAQVPGVTYVSGSVSEPLTGLYL